MAGFSFSRKWLDEILQNEELSPKEKAQRIMEGHIEITDGLKDERDSYKKQAEENGENAANLQKELDGIKGGEDWKKRYSDEHKAFEEFKKQTENAAQTAKVRAAYRALLLSEGISEKRIEGIIKVAEARGDIAKMKLDEGGNLEDAKGLKDAIAKEWGEFKATVSEKGADVANPPSVAKPTKTREEILNIKDTSERQKAIAENLQLFGKG